MKPNKSYGRWLLLLALAAMAVGYTVFVFMPLEKTIARIENDIHTKRAYCRQIAQMLPLRKATEDQLEETEAFNLTWEKTAPDPQMLSPILGRISLLSKQHGVSLRQFDPEPVKIYDRLAEVPLLVGMTGSFPQVFAFLHAIECLPQSIWIEKLKIRRSGNVDNMVLCNLELTIFANSTDDPDNSDQANLD